MVVSKKIQIKIRLGLVSAALLLAGCRSFPTFQVNLWSVECARRVLNGIGISDMLQSSPMAHERGLAWLAQDAVKRGEANQGLRILMGKNAPSDPVSLHIRGEVLEAAGYFDRAVAAWKSAGD